MRRRMGRPGVIGTMARTAVIAGTATATVNTINGRAQQKAAAQQQSASQQDQMAQMQQEMAAMEQQMAQGQQPAPAAPTAPAAAAGGTDVMAELEKLGQMKAAGILTDEEFAAAKAKLLGI